MLGAKGLAGGLKLELLTDWPERIELGALLWVEGEEQPRRVMLSELGGRVPVIALEGLESREAAEQLVGRFLEAQRRSLPEGSYYWHELEGLEVVDEAGAPIGQLLEVFRAGENEVYRIGGEVGELLIPALRSVVLEIDLERRRMVVRRPDVEEVG